MVIKPIYVVARLWGVSLVPSVSSCLVLVCGFGYVTFSVVVILPASDFVSVSLPVSFYAFFCLSVSLSVALYRSGSVSICVCCCMSFLCFICFFLVGIYICLSGCVFVSGSVFLRLYLCH